MTNSRGEGVQAALGLQVVDEAVFALAEKQPGFAKVFFYLEQEVMKPRYEIHSIGMTRHRRAGGNRTGGATGSRGASAVCGDGNREPRTSLRPKSAGVCLRQNTWHMLSVTRRASRGK